MFGQPANLPPSSLHTYFLPDFEEVGNSSLPGTHRYHTLKKNSPPVENDGGKYRPLTSKNWRRYLVANVSRVYIPISQGGIHWKLIEDVGHDRVVELQYTGSQPIATDDVQLNFCPVWTSRTPLPDGHLYHRLACRVSKLDTYDRKMYYIMNDEEIARDRLRMRLVGWRDAVMSRRDDLTDRIMERNPSATRLQEEEVYNAVSRCVPGIIVPEPTDT